MVTVLLPSYSWYFMVTVLLPSYSWYFMVTVLLPSYSWYLMVNPLLVVRASQQMLTCSGPFTVNRHNTLCQQFKHHGQQTQHLVSTVQTPWSTDSTPCINSSNSTVNRHKTLFQQFKQHSQQFTRQCQQHKHNTFHTPLSTMNTPYFTRHCQQ